jgi:diguanylate cyclase (GGDEF)-like protein/PAS domain S-box-containing protein
MVRMDQGLLPLETFRLLVEESLTGLYLIQNDRLVYVNQTLADFFGYSREEMLALPSALDVIEPNDREMVREKMRQRLAGEVAAVKYAVRAVRKDGQIITLDVRGLATSYAGAPAVMGSMLDITAQQQMEDALRNLSLIDDLTGVYNRRGFMTLAERHLTMARRRKRELLLIFADVDELKRINDDFGHATGDVALVEAAAILRKTYRSADIIARLGGDEFTAFPLEAGSDNASLLLKRLQDAIDRYNAESKRPYQLSMSVGISRFDPERCQTIQQLLEEADLELYARKRARPQSRS